MSIRPLSWSIAAATLCLSVAGGAQAQQMTATASSNAVSCNGGTNGFATVVATGGAGGYTYSWSPAGGTAATASGLAAGSYSVTITDSLSAQIVENVTITEPAVLGGNISKTDATSASAWDGVATVTPSGGTAPYTYIWSPSGGTAATANGLTQGAYSVMITDNNGCFTTRNVNVGVTAAPPPTPVPTLTEWAMILLTGLLALFGAARLGFLPAARKD